jgi:glycosyltransferase involved in cell wall biosynthesis
VSRFGLVSCMPPGRANIAISYVLMEITVVLCTFNRSRSLTKALDSILAQVVPESLTWEILVIDNNSNDDTREVVRRYCRRYPERIRYIFEPNQGLSRARNSGVRDARGEIIAFIDDDVIASPAWLRNLTASLNDTKWAGTGGRIVPPENFNPPRWLTVGGDMDLLGALLPLFDLGDEPGETKRPPYGANMAFRRSMFEKHGFFRVDLGRCGESLLMGEDIEFGSRLMAAGERLRYEPSSVVQHPVPMERVNKKHFRNWWMDYGRTRVIQRVARPPIAGIPRSFLSLAHLIFRFLPNRIMRWFFTFSTPRRFYNECQVWLTFGEIAQTFSRCVQGGRAEQDIASQSS